MRQTCSESRGRLITVERPHERCDLLGGCVAFIVRQSSQRHWLSCHVAIYRVPMQSNTGIRRRHDIPGHWQWKFVCGLREEGDLAVDFLPYFGSLRESEHEFGVDQVCPRRPSFAEELHRADRQTAMIRLHAPPINRSQDHRSEDYC